LADLNIELPGKERDDLPWNLQRIRQEGAQQTHRRQPQQRIRAGYRFRRCRMINVRSVSSSQLLTVSSDADQQGPCRH
jgi:hypothetical protein